MGFVKQENFTICLGPLFGNYSNEKAMTEFIEMHKILGVKKIAIYDYDISPQILSVINMYQNLGIVDLYPWKPKCDVYYQGQLGMLNDCLYRYMFRTKYIAFVDIDEFIIPRKMYSWKGLFNQLENRLSPGTKACGFLFQCMIFNINLPDDESRHLYIKKTQMNNTITLLTKTKRSSRVFQHKHRSKAVVNPKLVDIMTVHYIKRPYGNCREENVPYTVAALHHYRKWKKSEDTWITDQTIFKYTVPLINSVSLFTSKTSE